MFYHNARSQVEALGVLSGAKTLLAWLRAVHYSLIGNSGPLLQKFFQVPNAQDALI